VTSNDHASHAAGRRAARAEGLKVLDCMCLSSTPLWLLSAHVGIPSWAADFWSDSSSARGWVAAARMTPILVLLFHVEPLVACPIDIVARGVVMKPVGARSSWRRGQVHRSWCCVLDARTRSPRAFLGVFFCAHFGSDGPNPGLVRPRSVRVCWSRLRPARAPPAGQAPRGARTCPCRSRCRACATLLIGSSRIGVGVHFCGVGFADDRDVLILYPRMRLFRAGGHPTLSGVPLVASAALAHMIFVSSLLAVGVES